MGALPGGRTRIVQPTVLRLCPGTRPARWRGRISGSERRQPRSRSSRPGDTLHTGPLHDGPEGAETSRSGARERSATAPQRAMPASFAATSSQPRIEQESLQGHNDQCGQAYVTQDDQGRFGRICLIRYTRLRLPLPQTATVTRRNVAGIDVVAGSSLMFLLAKRSSSSACRSPSRPPPAAASYAFMVGP